jgi:hypothetical protein
MTGSNDTTAGTLALPAFTRDPLATNDGIVARWIVPEGMKEAWDICERAATSSLVPAQFRGRPQDLFVAMIAALGVGLRNWFGALGNIAVINGKPSFFGDLPLGLVLSRASITKHVVKWHGKPYDDDFGVTVSMQRRMPNGTTIDAEETYTVADAKLAGLWGRRGKEGQPTPWITSPKRMLLFRARSFVQRDLAADVTQGMGIEGDPSEDLGSLRTIDAVVVEPGTSPQVGAARHYKTRNEPRGAKPGDTWQRGGAGAVAVKLEDGGWGPAEAKASDEQARSGEIAADPAPPSPVASQVALPAVRWDETTPAGAIDGTLWLDSKRDRVMRITGGTWVPAPDAEGAARSAAAQEIIQAAQKIGWDGDRLSRALVAKFGDKCRNVAALTIGQLAHVARSMQEHAEGNDIAGRDPGEDG